MFLVKKKEIKKISWIKLKTLIYKRNEQNFFSLFEFFNIPFIGPRVEACSVSSHKFLTKGTVEERIDMMLQEKTRLSQDVIAAAGESWITEMKDDQLLDLFKLTL